MLTSENNVLSARAKRSLLHRRSESKMVWDFIGLYIRNGTLLIRCAHSRNIVQHSKRHSFLRVAMLFALCITRPWEVRSKGVNIDYYM